MHGATLIEKEHISNLKFPAKDVLTDSDAVNYRQTELERAATIGNAHHTKVKIIFHTADEGLVEVETTVWAATEKYATLKGGVTIPVHAIEHIVIY